MWACDLYLCVWLTVMWVNSMQPSATAASVLVKQHKGQRITVTCKGEK